MGDCANMKIALIYNHKSPLTTGAYFERVFKKAKLSYELFGVDGESSIPKGFDLYFRIDHGDYKFDISADLHPAVFYVIDTHLPKPYKQIRKQVAHYDAVFCAQKQGAVRLKQQTRADVQWMPLGADPDIHAKIDVANKAYDIGFVGRNAAKTARGRHLELLRRSYPNSFIDQADFTQMGRIYSASKIGFNSSIANDINMRIFEIMASGCMLLTSRIDRNGLDELFEDNTHLVSFGNDKELIERADYYLAHETERQRIADAGYALVMRKHTYFHRVQSIMNYLAFKFGGSFNELRI
jgi:glycosyltransferase involved in cell wall biosynthesis